MFHQSVSGREGIHVKELKLCQVVVGTGIKYIYSLISRVFDLR